VDLPDGTYTDVISGNAAYVFEQTLRCEGHAMILFADNAD